jgi:hypothetical protein
MLQTPIYSSISVFFFERLEIPENCSKEEMRAGAEEVYIVVEGFSKRGG